MVSGSKVFGGGSVGDTFWSKSLSFILSFLTARVIQGVRCVRCAVVSPAIIGITARFHRTDTPLYKKGCAVSGCSYGPLILTSLFHLFFKVCGCVRFINPCLPSFDFFYNL